MPAPCFIPAEGPRHCGMHPPLQQGVATLRVARKPGGGVCPPSAPVGSFRHQCRQWQALLRRLPPAERRELVLSCALAALVLTLGALGAAMLAPILSGVPA